MERLTIKGINIDFVDSSTLPSYEALYNRLRKYEDLEEKEKILIVPQIPKNKTLYWIWGNEVMPVTYKRITSCVVDDNGTPHIMCEMRTKKDRTFIRTYRRKSIENTFKAGDKRYFYSVDIGKTVFFTRKEAEAALQKTEGTHEEEGRICKVSKV